MEQENKKNGVVKQIIGAVVDVYFEDDLPEIYTALEVETSSDKKLVLEVTIHVLETQENPSGQSDCPSHIVCTHLPAEQYPEQVISQRMVTHSPSIQRPVSHALSHLFSGGCCGPQSRFTVIPLCSSVSALH